MNEKRYGLEHISNVMERFLDQLTRLSEENQETEK